MLKASVSLFCEYCNQRNHYTRNCSGDPWQHTELEILVLSVKCFQTEEIPFGEEGTVIEAFKTFLKRY